MGYLEDRTNEIRPLLHEISNCTYAQRKTSPLTLPLRNFSSQITKDLKGYWYDGLDKRSNIPTNWNLQSSILTN